MEYYTLPASIPPYLASCSTWACICLWFWTFHVYYSMDMRIHHHTDDHRPSLLNAYPYIPTTSPADDQLMTHRKEIQRNFPSENSSVLVVANDRSGEEFDTEETNTQAHQSNHCRWCYPLHSTWVVWLDTCVLNKFCLWFQFFTCTQQVRSCIVDISVIVARRRRRRVSVSGGGVVHSTTVRWSKEFLLVLLLNPKSSVGLKSESYY